MILTEDGQLCDGMDPIWFKQVRWSRYKTETDSDGKQTLRGERSGTIMEFLDEFESVCNKYVYHRYILHRTRLSNTQFDRIARPGMLKLDVDWAENYTMLHAREIQSEYWLMKQVGLFIGIGKMLSADQWEATTGLLQVGAEVTVTSTEHGMFYGTVVARNSEDESSMYIVGDSGGVRHQFRRGELRARVWVTVAHVGVTNDKKHDTYSTQHMMQQFLREWLTDHKEIVHSVHIHSDNAGSHFKSSKTLNYLSRMPEFIKRLRELRVTDSDEPHLLEEPTQNCQCTWSFGCPGHGKGPWDGFGGLMKRVMRRDTVDGNVILKNYAECAAHLRARFCTEMWQQTHGLESRYTINRVSVVEADVTDIDRRENEIYDSVTGIRKSFGYLALGEGRVLQRWFDCWCPSCLLATAPGMGSMDSNYKVAGCTSGERWWECAVELQGTRGVAAQRKDAQRKGRELAAKLTPGTFIAVQDRENQNHAVPFLVGITRDAGDGTCIAERVKGRKWIEGTQFDDGDFLIVVQWYAVTPGIQYSALWQA